MNVSAAWRRLQISQAKMGEILGISQQHVSRLVENGTLEKDKQGKILLVQSLKKYYTLRADEMEKQEVSFEKERALNERAKREMNELRLGREKHDLHKTEDILFLVGGMVIEFRQRILSLPSKMATSLVGKSQEEINNILTQQLTATLTELSRLDADALIRAYDDSEEEEPEEKS